MRTRHTNAMNAQITIAPIGAATIDLNFVFFDLFLRRSRKLVHPSIKFVIFSLAPLIVLTTNYKHLLKGIKFSLTDFLIIYFKKSA